METTNVLVLHASKHGATRRIAEQVWRTLRDAGLHAELRAAEDDPEPARYQAVVLGTAIYIGQWRAEAVHWLHQHQAVLSRMPLWIFASGPTGQGEPEALLKGEVIPPKMEALMKVLKPRQVRLFHGVLRPNEMTLLERMAINMVKAPLGDFRDWKAIEQWAADIAGQLIEGHDGPSETLPELQVESALAKTAVGVV
jgi:menaquinone-dependent protoporphyrinogen oxidase